MDFLVKYVYLFNESNFTYSNSQDIEGLSLHYSSASVKKLKRPISTDTRTSLGPRSATILSPLRRMEASLREPQPPQLTCYRRPAPDTKSGFPLFISFSIGIARPRVETRKRQVDSVRVRQVPEMPRLSAARTPLSWLSDRTRSRWQTQTRSCYAAYATTADDRQGGGGVNFYRPQQQPGSSSSIRIPFVYTWESAR